MIDETLAPPRMLIAGEWVASDSGATLEIVDPATEERIAEVPAAEPRDLDAALKAAEEGFAVWRATDAWTRSAVLRRTATILAERHERLAELLTLEQGKPLAEARAEIGTAIDQFDWFADEARRAYGRLVPSRSPSMRFQVLREPVGPVAAFTPWNFPSLLPARKIAPALAAGCSMVVKPAEDAPLSTLALAAALVEAGLPPGVLNVVTGDPQRISAHLLGSRTIRKVSLTGSAAVGRLLMRMAAEHFQRVSMELGGHAATLVFGDVDPEEAGRACARGKFRNAGQVCISATRFFVEERVREPFIAAFVAETEALRVGDGREPGTEIGPLTSERRRVAIHGHVQDALARGATLLAGGEAPRELERGYFYRPTVLTDVPASAEVMQVEPFGPVAAIGSFTKLDEAISLANSTPFGLAGYVFTRDLTVATVAAERLEVGIVGVNTFAVGAAQIPFGGVKQSGFGSESGTEAMEGYTIAKAVAIQL